VLKTKNAKKKREACALIFGRTGRKGALVLSKLSRSVKKAKKKISNLLRRDLSLWKKKRGKKKPVLPLLLKRDFFYY
jgi:hypothetical protein